MNSSSKWSGVRGQGSVARSMLFLLALLALAVPAPATQGKKKGAKGAPAAQAAPEVVNVPAPAGGIDLPAYTRAVLPNGLTVLLMEHTENPLVYARLTVRSGAADDPKGKEGLAALTAELLTAGTPTRSAEKIAQEVDFVGGQLGAAADADNTIVTSEFLDRDARKQLDLLSDVTLRPAFAQAEVDRIRSQRLTEIAGLAENPDAFATAQFEAAVFAGTPYAHPAQGLRKSVEAITREDVASFHQANYAPNNAVLAVVGSFKTPEMLEMVRAAFGGWERRNVTHAPFGSPAAVAGRRIALVDFPNMNQTQVRIGAVGIARNDADYVPIQVANAILSAGFSSRLTEEIRVNRSLTYRIRSGFNAGLRPGSFFITTFTKNATTREIIDATFGELKKFRDGPIREGELTRAKNIVLARTTQQLETPAGIAGMISTIEIYGLPKDYVEALAGRVRGLTTADIAPVIRKHFEADNVLVLVFTTASETRKQLDGLGTVEVKSFLE
jgi:zinc protease